jgi:hypothetical protein
MCCTLNCANKPCGAPDGCGGTCNQGTCPGGEFCQSGVCQPQTCNPPCGCGQLCVAGTCQNLCPSGTSLCGCSSCCPAGLQCNVVTGNCGPS